MQVPQINLAKVEQWAYSTDLDEEFNQQFESDPNWDRAIRQACSLEDIYRLTADGRCLKRTFFAQQLMIDLGWVFSTTKPLPFQFSRTQGIVEFDAYISSIAAHAMAVYERCLLIERMRLSEDAALHALAKVFLDHRHAELQNKQKEYIALRQTLHFEVDSLFKNSY